MSPKISVVVPAFNAERYIGAAIQSVLSQSYQDFELIVVDDGSQDDTGRIVHAIHDDRIRYVRKENGGPATARNYALSIATGEYIAYCDADDQYKENHLQ